MYVHAESLPYSTVLTYSTVKKYILLITGHSGKG